MEDNKFWLSCWAIVGGVICTLILSVMTYNINASSKIVEMVEKGANPIQAACAINGSVGTQALTCMQSVALK